MKKITILVFLICIISLNALSVQEARDLSEKNIMSMLSSQRNDLTQLFVNPYPYTLLMYHQAVEMQYTRMDQFVWDPIEEDWVLLSDLFVDYDGMYPTTFTQSMNYEGQDFTMIYEFTIAGGIVTNLVISADLMGQMMETSRETYTYDGDHWVELLSERNNITEWENDTRFVATWTGENITQVLEQDWEGDEDGWRDDQKETWEYSGSNPSHYLYQYWDGYSWENDEQEDYTFSGDILMEELGQMWDNSTWVNDYKTTYEWNGDMPTSHLEYEWDGSGWINDQFVTYYEDEGNLGYVISQTWEEERTWVNDGKWVYYQGTATDDDDIPQVASELNNYPNPFNPTTNISFTMASEGHITLDIFNVRGQKVETLFDGHKNAGPHTLTWDAKVAGGVYFAVMNTDGERVVRKMVLLK